MPCYHPLKAWKYERSGSVVFREPSASHLDGGGVRPLRLPCGNCIGCRTQRAQHWALRCSLELQRHDRSAFVTLTYDEAHCPPTLRKSDLSGFLKRLREDLSPRRIRFFASGEYGDRFGRPHYHAILFGVSPDDDAERIRMAWGISRRRGACFVHTPFGLVDVDKVTPKVVSYVAGYCSKKLGWKAEKGQQRVDPETGEVYQYEPPFILASRGGRGGVGLAGASRDAHPESWRKFAVLGGAQVSVPRYLHEGWKRQATEQELVELEQEKLAAFRERTREELQAGERNALARHNLATQRRSRRG